MCSVLGFFGYAKDVESSTCKLGMAIYLAKVEEMLCRKAGGWWIAPGQRVIGWCTKGLRERRLMLRSEPGHLQIRADITTSSTYNIKFHSYKHGEPASRYNKCTINPKYFPAFLRLKALRIWLATIAVEPIPVLQCDTQPVHPRLLLKSPSLR